MQISSKKNMGANNGHYLRPRDIQRDCITAAILLKIFTECGPDFLAAYTCYLRTLTADPDEVPNFPEMDQLNLLPEHRTNVRSVRLQCVIKLDTVFADNNMNELIKKEYNRMKK